MTTPDRIDELTNADLAWGLAVVFLVMPFVLGWRVVTFGVRLAWATVTVGWKHYKLRQERRLT